MINFTTRSDFDNDAIQILTAHETVHLDSVTSLQGAFCLEFRYLCIKGERQVAIQILFPRFKSGNLIFKIYMLKDLLKRMEYTFR